MKPSDKEHEYLGRHLYTTKPEYERSGMGFAFMEAFMDDLQVLSAPGRGCKVIMEKKLGSIPWLEELE